MSSADALRPSRPLALVTGAAWRVGRAIALELARTGCDLILTHRRSREQAQQTADEASSLGATARCEALDLDSIGQVERFADRLAREPAPLDVLVHNAAVYEPSPLGEISGERALRLYRVNALAPLILSARLADRLARSALPGGGAIVLISDIHALGRPRRHFAAYAMSKAALTGLLHSLAVDLAPATRVNAIAPGVVAFPEVGPEADPQAQERYLSRVPLALAGTPEIAARAVRWLALEATYTTGTIIRVDGGRCLA